MRSNTSYQHTITQELGWIVVFLGLIWLIFLLDLFLPLEQLGLLPRHLSGLSGIAAMHFLHGNWHHLLSNTVPLLVLLALLAGSRANSIRIVISICLIGGGLLWLIGRPSLHIGASLLIFGLASFLVLAGIIEKRLSSLLISAAVVIIYGSSLLSGLLPFSSRVSWEGHLSGLLAGVICAYWLIPRNITNNHYN